MIKIYNSLTNQLEEFKPITENEVKMYVCGSTVYNSIHIGNSRPVIFFDVVARFFQYLGYQVKLVSNFTDIDDKIIKRAQEENVSEAEISEKYIKEILQSYDKLHILPHYKNPKVTETIPQIISFIELLIEKKSAYVVDGDVYFDVTKVHDYGILSGQTQENLIAGARVSENELKHNPNDFNLWKKTTVGKKWPSPWGDGRPGWHTECVVMINDIFGGKIDIHGGGVELKFPHHDNEIAQAEIAYGHHLANYWMHNGRIDMQGEKMSKSLGNVIWADDLVDKIGYGIYRLIILNVPYRQPFNYKDELIEQASNDYEKIKRACIGLYRKLQLEFGVTDYECELNDNEIVKLNDEFITALSDDFNTANAITVIFKAVKLANMLVRQASSNLDILKQTLKLLNNFLWVLGIDFPLIPLNEEEVELVKRWNQARKDKDFALADSLRTEIYHRGIII